MRAELWNRRRERRKRRLRSVEAGERKRCGHQGRGQREEEKKSQSRGGCGKVPRPAAGSAVRMINGN